MELSKIGQIIRTLRTEQQLTQHQLAAALGVTDQAVSKWECGLGCPDLSTLPALAQQLGISVDYLLAAEPAEQRNFHTSLRNPSFYFCPKCGNWISAINSASLSCCGRSLSPLTHQKLDELHKLNLDRVEDEWFITSSHPMEKEHHLAFAVLVTGDQILTLKRWPEWDFQLRLPSRSHGFLYWYCTQHGLFRQVI